MTTPPSTAPRPFVFVLMPFEAAFDDIYRFGIKGAAEEVGAYAARVDEQMFWEGILDRVFNQINKADVVIADMTGRNANVFYEVGYAHALGKLVLLLTQDANDIPFDLKHHQHTVYGGRIEALRSDLTVKLRWALQEVRNRAVRSRPGALELSLRGLPIPAPAPEPMTELAFRANASPFLTTFALRNASGLTTESISHVYFFTEPDAAMVPCLGSKGRRADRPIYEASAPDARGLAVQYRLPISLPPLPPGAVERVPIQLMFRGRHERAKAASLPHKLT